MTINPQSMKQDRPPSMTCQSRPVNGRGENPSNEEFVAAIPHPRSTEEESTQVIRLMDASFYVLGNGTLSMETGEHSASHRSGNTK